MAESTGISWCDATFNGWIGCERVSPGCARCYAEELVTEGRLKDRFADTWGPDGTRRRTSDATWKKPLRWEKLALEGKLPDGSENPDGHRPRVFCASLADVFEPRPELDDWRHDLLELVEATPSLDWQLLTKRPEVAREWLTIWNFAMLPNLWLGVSIENARHTWRADVLREIPASVKFISAEPLLGSLFQTPSAGERDDARAARRLGRPPRDAEGQAQTDESAPRGVAPLDLTGIDWLIVGGESGGREARPMHPAWARELRDACLALGQYEQETVCCGNYLRTGECCSNPVPGDFVQTAPRPAFFFKQWGSWSPAGIGDVLNTRLHGGVLPDGRPSTIVEEGAAHMVYRGPAPTSGGHHLDGREWQEFPVSAAVAVSGSLF